MGKFIFISILLIHCLSCNNSIFAQYSWREGVIASKSGLYEVSKSAYGSIRVQKKDDDVRREMEFGFSLETGKVEVIIVSESEFISIINETFSIERIELLAKEEKSFSISILLDEEGVPINVNFFLKPKSLITFEDLLFIESQILARVRYVIRREMPFGKPCVYPAGVKVKFDEVLKGELRGLKINEQKGKEKPEWER